ncbi:MAG TPA: hypothetical protein VII24_03780 [Pseudolabrys sp.]
MPSSNPAPSRVSHASKIAERLLAHARLCHDIADASWHAETAAQLEQLAEQCVRAAAGVGPDGAAGAPLH